MRGTAAQITKLGEQTRATHLRVEVDRSGAGDFEDLCNIDGVDWVESVDIDEEVDNNANSCTIKIAQSAYGDSSSAMMESAPFNNLGASFVPFVYPWRDVKIYSAVLDYGVSPATSDYDLIFEGKIIGVNQGKVRCLDLYCDLQRAFIETDRIVYGSESGDDIEDVIQALLDDHHGSVTLYSPNGTAGTPFNASDSPNFLITTFEQSQMPLSEAIEALVLNTPYVCRYRWHENTSAFQLQLFEPDRSVTTADHSFTADDYFSIDNVPIEIDNIRNVIKLRYLEASTGLVKTASATDATSISDAGRRYLGIALEQNKIDTSTEANTLVDTVLADTSTPTLEHVATHPLFWVAELGDYYEYKANGVHYDTDQKFAVTSIRHVLSNGYGRTTIGVRGKPSGGLLRWLRLDAHDLAKIGRGVIGPEEGNTRTSNANMVPNGEFGAWSRDVEAYLPDGWAFVSPVNNYGASTFVTKSTAYDYGSSGDAYYDDDALTAGAALVVYPDASYSIDIASPLFPVTEGESYDLSWWYKKASASTVFVYLSFYDATGDFLQFTGGSSGSVTGAWDDNALVSSVVAPSGARYARVEIITEDAAGGATAFDKITLARA